MTENEKTTALIPSVGADGGQPPHNSTYQSIPHETCESNPPEENIEEMREKIRRMNDPHYLHTVSMTELYQTAYKSSPSLTVCSTLGHTSLRERPRWASRS